MLHNIFFITHSVHIYMFLLLCIYICVCVYDIACFVCQGSLHVKADVIVLVGHSVPISVQNGKAQLSISQQVTQAPK